MNRNALRALLPAAALAATVVALPSASATGTPASGSVTVTATNAFLTQELRAGIAEVPLPSATGGYSSTAGGTATFPVTGGDAVLPRFVGSITLGGGLAFADGLTGKIICFHQVAFGGDTQALTAVPDGQSTPVTLFVLGDNTVGSGVGVTPQTLTGDADLDPSGAAYLDQALHTSFFTGGQIVGSLSVTFTPAS
ncbi:hypothetical protein Caci_7665 [Catenulispora acidiphila DSM 44928]|uniref:Secreted protein n=1 Tax=Catenulispora acidiphila (strain DSM 44928 / JCM 14897 / NBRC 102108 / NRRL B-24433 / ID139908) TaxID=479433 RepID=C7QCM6_CATAD|nr:hypothetical protein [Catenulispora acidiphila]ACU76489.1 hypothetical protein Caci_7665 [Catenulispora acidiphila DSM 44928]